MAAFQQDGVKSYRKINLEHQAGEVFSVIPETSNRETLWSELFQEKERAMMRKHLISRVVSFSVKDTYQISVRMLWTKEALQSSLSGQATADTAIAGPVALLCHDFGGKLTSSWTWAKLAYPLYKAGISVVLVDFPGFGLSRICGRSDVDSSDWIEKDWRIVVMLMDTLKIRKAHLITCGKSCNLVLKMLKFVKLRIELTHIFFNPVMDLDALFPVDAIRSGGVAANGLQKFRFEQRNAFELLLHNSRIKIWAIFDQSTQSTQQTNKIFTSFAELAYASDQISVTQLGEEHISAASAGSTVHVPMLFPCRYLKHGFVRFLKCDHTFTPPKSLLPEQLHDSLAEDLKSGPNIRRSSSQAAFLATPSNALNVAIDVCSASPVARQSAMATMAQVRTATPAGRGGAWGAAPTTRAASAPTRAASAAGTSRSTLRSGAPDGGALAQVASCFVDGGVPESSRGTSDGRSLIERPTDIKSATKLACQIQRADVQQERRALLANTKSVTRLKNWTELRGGGAPRTSDLHPQEAAAIEDALDLSMQTLEADADRRRRPSSEGLGTSRRRRNEKLMAKLRDLHVGATGNEGFGGSAPHPVPRYAGGD